MAVCKSYRRYCISDDITVLLKAILRMAFFELVNMTEAQISFWASVSKLIDSYS